MQTLAGCKSLFNAVQWKIGSIFISPKTLGYKSCWCAACTPLGPQQLYFIIPNKTRYFLDHILNHCDIRLCYLHILTLNFRGEENWGWLRFYMNPHNDVSYHKQSKNTINNRKYYVWLYICYVYLNSQNNILPVCQFQNKCWKYVEA